MLRSRFILKKEPLPLKLLFVVTEDWYFVSHRLSLAQTAVRAGFEVAVAMRVNQEPALKQLFPGIRVFPLYRLDRAGRNPWREVWAVLELYGVIRRWRPDLVHLISLKPLILGNIAALFAGVSIRVSTLTGLGFVLRSEKVLARLLRIIVIPVLILILRGDKCRIIVQNSDDFRFLVGLRIAQQRIRLIKGSGVDPSRFSDHPLESDRVYIVCVTRMLKDKGVVHFFQMAQALRKEKSGATCVLVGGIDPDNPSSLSKQQIDAMTATGEIEWWGYRKDIPEVLRKAAIVCLFSLYGEGVPKALLEAASCGKPLVAYDVPGCREIVRDGYNGFLIPRDDVYAATNALKHLITNPDLRAEMGRRSRQIVISEFSETIVNTKTLKVYQEIVFG